MQKRGPPTHQLLTCGFCATLAASHGPLGQTSAGGFTVVGGEHTTTAVMRLCVRWQANVPQHAPALGTRRRLRSTCRGVESSAVMRDKASSLQQLLEACGIVGGSAPLPFPPFLRSPVAAAAVTGGCSQRTRPTQCCRCCRCHMWRCSAPSRSSCSSSAVLWCTGDMTCVHIRQSSNEVAIAAVVAVLLLQQPAKHCHGCVCATSKVQQAKGGKQQSGRSITGSLTASRQLLVPSGMPLQSTCLLATDRSIAGVVQ